MVEELNNDGHDILMLDLAEPDNQQLSKELQAEYGKQCGTPWFINADTGEHICGYREKDVLEKWLAGESIPEPPRQSGPMPKIPLQGASNKEEIAWKKNYTEWLKNNEHMPEDWHKRQQSASKILDNPRPKSDPPRPPMGPNLATTSDDVIDKWGDDMKKWQEENNHLPNLQPVDNMIQQIKNRKNQLLQQQPNANTAGNNLNETKLNTLDAKVQALEVKIDKLMNHFGVK
jgi:hypothetical protein